MAVMRCSAGAVRPVVSHVDVGTIDRLTPRGRAALLAATLARMAPIVERLESVWPSVQVPAEATIAECTEIAEGHQATATSWQVELKHALDSPPNLRDL